MDKLLQGRLICVKKYYYLKCILDYMLAIIGIIISLPFLIMISILILFESRGPIIFVQERVGQNGKVFNIYKFRTMIDGAINMGDGLHTYEGDSRITRIGAFLRKTSLDELPQIFNVLKGEMSFIGPRPPVPYYPRKYEEYDEIQKKRFLLKPGISGYAQVMVRNGEPWDERIKYDVTYVENISLFFDLKTFFLTISSVVNRKNIY